MALENNNGIIQKISSAYIEELTDDIHGGKICPICSSGAGAHGTGMTEKDGHWACWPCGFVSASGFDIWALKNGYGDIDLQQHIQVADVNEAIKAALEYFPQLRENGRSSAKDDFQPLDDKPAQQGESPFSTGKALAPEAAERQKYIYACHKQVGNTDYWRKRGITAKAIQRFKLGYDAYKKGAVIPLELGGSYAYTMRRMESADIEKYGGKYMVSKGGKAHLFNLEALKQSRSAVFIVEGAIDAMSLFEVGAEAIALNSVSNKNQLIEAVRKSRPTVPLLVAMDNDEAGRRTATALERELRALGVTCSIHNPALEGCKDCNESLVKNREMLQKSAVHSLEEWRAIIAEKTSVKGYFDNILGYFKAKKTCYKTGLPALDRVLGGGFYPGITFIGAVSSLGKTTFLLQVADNLAKQGINVLYFSLEMSRAELVAKSLSRESLQLYQKNGGKGYRLTTRDILSRYEYLSPEERQALKRSSDRYLQYAGRLWIIEGVGDISVAQVRQTVEGHIKTTGKKPVVMIDYAQILAPDNEREYYSDGTPKPARSLTDKQKTDNDTVSLKQLSRDLDLPIICISSFNRANYDEPVNTASFKESGAIEYSSDTLLAMQFPYLNYQKIQKEKNGKTTEVWENEAERAKRIHEDKERINEMKNAGNPVTVEVKVLKNRNAGLGSVNVELIAKYNTFSESSPFGEVTEDDTTIFDNPEVTQQDDEENLFPTGEENTISGLLKELQKQQPDNFPAEIVSGILVQFIECGKRGKMKVGEKLLLGDMELTKVSNASKYNPAQWKDEVLGIEYTGE